MPSKSKDQRPKTSLSIWTIGHSTHSWEEFKEVLSSHSISQLVDVRSFPGSRRYPHFNKEALSQSLQCVGIKYHHSPSLGGRRHGKKDSHNTAWQNASFRAYADHMETEEFKKGIKELLELAAQAPTAIMCAEALWWRCHRSLISDYLKSIGVEVLHIADEKRTEVHPYTSAASLIEGKLSYRGLF